MRNRLHYALLPLLTFLPKCESLLLIFTSPISQAVSDTWVVGIAAGN